MPFKKRRLTGVNEEEKTQILLEMESLSVTIPSQEEWHLPGCQAAKQENFNFLSTEEKETET